MIYNKLKKIISVSVILGLVLSLIVACGKKEEKKPTSYIDKQVEVTDIYDFEKNVKRKKLAVANFSINDSAEVLEGSQLVCAMLDEKCSRSSRRSQCHHPHAQGWRPYRRRRQRRRHLSRHPRRP